MTLGPAVFAVWLIGPPIQRPSTIQLDWQAPPGCPSKAEVRERLRELTPESSSLLWVKATIAALESGSGFEVELRVANVEGESVRSFPADDCATLTDAIVLVVAVTIDPVGTAVTIAAGRAPEPSPAPEPLPVPQPLPMPESSPELEPTPELAEGSSIVLPLDREPEPARGRLRFGLRVYGGAGYGPTRGGSGNLGGGLAVLGKRWRWELDGIWSAPRVVRPANSVIAGTFDGWSVGTRGCFVPVAARVIELPLCLGIEVGQVRGRGLVLPTRLALDNVERARFLWVAPILAQGLWWAPLDRLAIGVELELLVPLTRGQFTIDDRGVERIAEIGVRGLIGIEVRLP